MRKQYLYKSTLCDLYLVASAQGLQGVFWKKQTDVENIETLVSSDPAVSFIKQTRQEIMEYLKGERKTFDVQLDLQGTAFQKRVWMELTKIPYGKTWSYAELATGIENKKAVRAVGTANSKNPISIIVPCHRVIGSNGTLTGYAGGLPIKEKLLRLENAIK